MTNKKISLFDLMLMNANSDLERRELLESLNIDNLNSGKRKKRFRNTIKNVKLNLTSIFSLINGLSKSTYKLSCDMLDKISGSSIFDLFNSKSEWKRDTLGISINGIDFTELIEVKDLVVVKFNGNSFIKKLTFNIKRELESLSEFNFIMDKLSYDSNLAKITLENTSKPTLNLEGLLKIESSGYSKLINGEFKFLDFTLIGETAIPKFKGREVYNEEFNLISI